MPRTRRARFASCLLLFGTLVPVCGQAPAASDLGRVGERLVGFFKQWRPGWEHSTVEPAAAPGQQPGRDVAIHFWRSDKCLIVEAVVDGVRRPEQPVYCMVKVAAYQFSTAEAAREHLKGFVDTERSMKKPGALRPLALGEEAYGWGRSNVVFRKGRFSYWLSSSVGNSYGHDQFELEKQATESFATDVARALPAN